MLDLATEQAKVVGDDPWMVPARTLNPVWSPDSKWVAYSSRLRSLYHAIFISNVETGEKKQVTDGLADAVWPTWDASGKYLWFLASTDFGLRSQWLDMTSYDHTTNFGLYFAVCESLIRVHCCRKAMRIVELVQALADCSRAHVREMQVVVQRAAVVVKVDNVERVDQWRCRSILMDFRNGSFQFPA